MGNFSPIQTFSISIGSNSKRRLQWKYCLTPFINHFLKRRKKNKNIFLHAFIEGIKKKNL